MVEYPLIAVWFLLNGFAAYLIYRTVKLVNNPQRRPTDPTPSDESGRQGDAAAAHSDRNVSPAQAVHPDDAQPLSADVEAIQCMNCGRIQEAGFMFCENCIEPLYR